MLTYSIIYMMISIIEHYKKHNKNIIGVILKIIGLSLMCVITSFIDLLTIWLQLILLFAFCCFNLAKKDDDENMNRKD